MECKCGNSVCLVRMARGLRSFCDDSLRAETKRPEDGSFPTYKDAAAARQPGQRVVSGGGYLNGSPRRFFLV